MAGVALPRAMRQLAQVVGVAQRVATGPIVAIAGPAVMDACARVAGQDANRLQGGRPARRMTGVVGQVLGAGDMRPLQPCSAWPRHAQARLVMMERGGLAQGRLDLFLDALQPTGAQAHQIDQRAHREGGTEDVGQDLTHPRIRHELLLDEIGRHRSQSRAVLLGSADARRRLGLGRRPTRRTAHMQDAVLGDMQSYRGQLLDLPPLDPAGCVAGQLLVARPAQRWPMRLYGVGSRHQRNPMTGMSWLRPALLATLLAQTLGLASQPIAGR